MINVDKFFYKTAVSLAKQQNISIKYLAEVCEVKPQTLSKMLKREDGSDISSRIARILRDEIAPNLTIDEFLIELQKPIELLLFSGQ